MYVYRLFACSVMDHLRVSRIDLAGKALPQQHGIANHQNTHHHHKRQRALLSLFIKKVWLFGVSR
jgi:hypothetical protein